MAAVQRRQTTGSSAKLAVPQSASFKQHKDKSQKEKLHSDRGYGSRSEHLTRAQAEFLSQHARATAPHKVRIPAKMRQTWQCQRSSLTAKQ